MKMKLVRVKHGDADGIKFVVTASAYSSIRGKVYGTIRSGDDGKDKIAEKIAGKGARYIENRGLRGYATILTKTGNVMAVGYWK